MIQIRNCVFETNSSSSHSIVCTNKDTYLETVNPEWRIRNGILEIWSEEDLEFERYPFDILSDWYGRLCYAIASCGYENLDEIRTACMKHISEFKDFKFPKDKWDDKEEDYLGHVDHQSSGLLTHTLNKHNISIEDFIFNDKYIVIIDGDEYCVFDRLAGSPIFSKENIEYIEDAIDCDEWYEENE